MGESLGKIGEEMPGIEEEVDGEEEMSDNDLSPELNGRPNASLEKALDKTEPHQHIR